jgi:hypothetical protein
MNYLEFMLDRFTTRQFYDKVSRSSLTGSGTRLTGPDGRSNSGITLSANLSVGNAAIAGNYTVLVFSDSATCIAGLALTAVGVVSNGWQGYYATGAGLAANLVVGTGNRLYGLRIHSETITTDAIVAWRDDVVFNEAQGYLGW